MRLLWLMVTLLLAPAAQAAPVFDDPSDLLEYAYQPYRDGNFPEDPYELWSPDLLERWALMVARTPDEEVGAVDFDPMINAQDHDLAEVMIGTPLVLDDRAVVTARFVNFGVPQLMRFTLVRGEGGWRIEDIEALTPGRDWRLTEILSSPAS
ncbi:MAG TPA: hypothetical protein VGN80_03550 [Devosiaceae bacterium]|jgi:hypothetical protein|nr:hypothetical protein [Devosiaceae bacterium]